MQTVFMLLQCLLGGMKRQKKKRCKKHTIWEEEKKRGKMKGRVGVGEVYSWYYTPQVYDL